MDKDRVKGAFRQAEGSLREATGKLMGDAKLKTEGSMMKKGGAAQNAMGGMKDALRDSKRERETR